MPDLFVELEVAGERASYRRFAMNDDSAVFHGAGALEDLAYGGRDSREQMGDGSGQNQKPKTKNQKRKTENVFRFQNAACLLVVQFCDDENDHLSRQARDEPSAGTRPFLTNKTRRFLSVFVFVSVSLFRYRVVEPAAG